MATIANIVINDGLAVATTFTPVGRITGSEAVRYNASAASVAERRLIQTEVKSKGSVDRVTAKITIPVYQVPAGETVPELSYSVVGSIDVSLPHVASAAIRKDIRVFLSNLLLNSQLVAMIDAGEHQLA
jgi:hypothetical protein